ncbi:hypothetical protein Tco_0271894 [Tanacetum coccineum]
MQCTLPTQGMRSIISTMVPFVFSIPFVLSWGGSISSDSFLPSYLLLVVIIVAVVIVVVILIVDTVVIVGMVIVVADLWGDPVGCSIPIRLDMIPPGQGRQSIGVPVANVTLSSSAHLPTRNITRFILQTNHAACASRAASIPSDPTDEDVDTRMGDSTGVSVSLGGEISSGGKKSRE